MASGALQRAAPALGLVQSQFPQPKAAFPAHHLLSAREGRAPALVQRAPALAQGREKV